MMPSLYRRLSSIIVCLSVAVSISETSAQQITRQLVRLSRSSGELVAEFAEAGNISMNGVLEPGRYRFECTNNAEIFLVPVYTSVVAASEVDIDFTLGAAPISFGNIMNRSSLLRLANISERIFSDEFGAFSDDRSDSSRVQGFFDELHSGRSDLISDTTSGIEGNTVGISWTSFGRLSSYSALNMGEMFIFDHHVVWLFEVEEETTYSLQGVIGNPVEGASQRSPRMPNGTAPGGGVSFRGAPSGDWMDPETTFGYDFTMDGDSKFTEILNFPSGFSDKFMVSVGETTHGPFTSSDSVDFQNLFGSHVSGFRVSGITPNVDGDDPTAFPIRLEFDTETADFTMTPLSKPFVEIRVLENRDIELKYDGVLQHANGQELFDPWETVSGATSPFVFSPSPSDPFRFWRATKVYPAAPTP